VAKKSTQSQPGGSQDITAETAGRTIYYDELHFIKTKDKTPYWGAQVLYFNKRVGEYFVQPDQVKFFRDLEEGEIDVKLYKQFIDPVTPDGKGGQAAYFKSNWQTCPIYMHLENIKEAQLKKLPLQMVCKAADEFSKLKQQTDNDKIIGAKYLRAFLNEINPQFGMRTLRKDEDPFAFINQIESTPDPQTQQQGTPPPTGQKSPQTANPTSQIEAIKAKIFDNDTLSIYNQYLYKDGVEVGIEIGIDTYLNSINKYKQSILPRIISDIKNFNAHIVRHYTSETTGRPVVEYQEPHMVKIGPCRKEDLSDNTFVIKEWEISFGEFVQMAGADLKPEILKEIFEKNRQFHNLMGDYERISTFQRNSAKIRIGYHEFETQNMDVYADYVSEYGNKVFKKVDDDYAPAQWAQKKLGAKRVEKHYNIWYSFYYIPLDSLYTISGTTSFSDQAKYIFKFGPIQDQIREGDDYRYAKGTFCGYKTKRFSFARIEHSFMPEIVKLWHLFQNDLSQSMSDGAIWDTSVLSGMMKYIDSGKTDKDAKKQMEVLKYIRQTNTAIADMNSEDGEQKIGKKTLFEKVSINSLDTAIKRLEIITQLYEMLTKSLGFNEVTEGQTPAARTNLGGINLSQMASSNASYHMEEALIAGYLTLGERIMYYIKDIVDEGGSRLDEFTDMVGQANSMAAQSIKDIPLHRLNLHLENQMTDELKQQIMTTANEMARAQIISPDQVLFLMFVENVKYAYAILAIEIRAGQKALQDSQVAARMQARSDQLFTSNLKIMEMHAMKADDANVESMIQNNLNQRLIIDNQLKLHGQVVTKNLINDHRTQQAIIDNRLQLNTLAATEEHQGHAVKTS
jgi:hypothetical protein